MIWNDVSTPVPDFFPLPDLGPAVPVRVVAAAANSLNNRFLPWDAVETDCVLQVDDDTRYLTPELISHGFR